MRKTEIKHHKSCAFVISNFDCGCIRVFLRESNAIEGVHGDESVEVSVKAWEYLVQQDVITNEVILETHKLLMKNQKSLKRKEKGVYRTIEVGIYKQNIIGIDPDGDKLLIEKVKVRDLLKAKLIQKKLDKWIKYLNKLVGKVPKIEEWVLEARIKKDHVEFESIHPFVDGNGRIGRLLMNWERIKLGLPIIIIYEKSKGEYYAWFREMTIVSRKKT